MSAETQYARAVAKSKLQERKANAQRAAELQKRLQPRKLGFKGTVKRYWQLWAMALPAVVFVAIFNYGPMYGIQLAFREFDLIKVLTG